MQKPENYNGGNDMMYYNGKPISYDKDDSAISNLNDYNYAQLDLPELPTGMPTGPSPIPLMPEIPETQVPQTIESIEYLPGYLRTQIGKNIRVEFLVGTTGPMVDRIGRLIGVGISYILLQPIESDDILVCDMYSIKFVYVYK